MNQTIDLFMIMDYSIKFVPNNSNILNRLLLATTDSKSLFDFVANIIHMIKHGCFCLGILTKYKTIERYNRWNNKDIDKYWTVYIRLIRYFKCETG